MGAPHLNDIKKKSVVNRATAAKRNDYDDGIAVGFSYRFDLSFYKHETSLMGYMKDGYYSCSTFLTYS